MAMDIIQTAGSLQRIFRTLSRLTLSRSVAIFLAMMAIGS